MKNVKNERPLWQKLMLSLASTLLFLLLLEVVSSILFKAGSITSFDKENNISLVYDYDTLYFNEPSRNARCNFKNVRLCHYQTNQLGFRDSTEIAEGKPEGEYRILCVGDSSTFGVTVDQMQTYPAQLQAILDARGNHSVHYCVINGGCAGFTSFQALRFMQHWVHKLKPDLIVYSIGFNDSVLSRESDKDADFHTKPLAWLQQAFHTSNTYLLLNQLLIANVKIAGKKKIEPTRIRVSLIDYKDNLKCSLQLARENGAALIFCPISVPPQYLRVMAEVAEANGVPLVDTEGALWRAYNVIWNGANGYAGQTLDYRGEIDTSFNNYAEMGELKCALMRTKSFVFDDSIHPNPIGYRAIAEDLAKWIPE